MHHERWLLLSVAHRIPEKPHFKLPAMIAWFVATRAYVLHSDCCRGIREPGYRYGDDDDVGSLEWHASLRRFDRARASSGPHRATSRFIPLGRHRTFRAAKYQRRTGDAWNAIQSIIG